MTHRVFYSPSFHLQENHTVVIYLMSSDREGISSIQEDSEDEFDWEEVDVPEHQPEPIEITLQLNLKSSKSAANKSVVDSRWLRN